MEWQIYYDNGVIFSSEDGHPNEGPPYGVLSIWQQGMEDDLYNKDYYLYRDDYECWIEVDLVGLIDNLVTACGLISAFKVGRTVPHIIWKSVMRRMNEDHP